MMYRRSNSIKALLALVLAIALLSSVGLASASAAGVALSPVGGTPYTLVTLSSSGFIAFDTIGVGNITFAGSPWNSEVIQIDSCGNWNASLRVPANAVMGPNAVVIKATGGTVVLTTFTVTAPPITLSPSSGPPYTLVTITGSSFVPLDTIPVGGIKFDGLPWNTEKITIDGSGMWATSLRVPQTAACCSGKAVLVTTAAGTLSAATFTITSPVVTVAPSSGPIGTKVIVCVTNMTPDGTVPAGGITFGGTPWNTNNIDIDGTGRMCSLFLTVPTTSSGAHPVVVNDGHLIAAGSFTITQPTISVTPASAYKGETVTVSGTGWPQHTPGSVSITFAGSPVDDIVTPDENGYFNVQFNVPLTAEAVNLIGAFDILGNTAVAKTLTLNSLGLTLNPQSGLPGTTVTVSGIGFQPYSGVDELKFGRVNILPGGLITDQVGTWTATFVVPGLPPGAYTVTAKVAGATLSAYYTLNEPVVTSSLIEPELPIGQALASISDRMSILWGFDNTAKVWKMYDPNDASGSTLTGLVSGRVYWIKVSEDCTLFSRQLTKGWDLLIW